MANEYLSTAVVSNILYSLAIIAVLFVVGMIMNKGFIALSHKFDFAAFRSRLLRRAIHYILFLGAILLILGRLGFETDALIAGLGTVLGLVAIGFVAVWSTLSNFLCTLIIVAFKLFKAGDVVSIPSENIKGKVGLIGLTFVHIEMEDGSAAHIPSNFFFQKLFIIHKPS